MFYLPAFFTDHSGEFDIAIRIYRGIFLFVLVTFLLALNTYGWRKAGVNHVLIFELDPRDHLSYQQLLEVNYQKLKPGTRLNFLASYFIILRPKPTGSSLQFTKSNIQLRVKATSHFPL